MNAYKVIVIGLDGATYDLIKPWAEEGKLPAFKQLLAEGTAGELCSTVPPMTGPAWTSFMTGQNPGKHGIYDWIYRQAGTYRFLPTTGVDCKAPTLWQILSRVERRVCLINIPMTYPPSAVNGCLISGMPAPSKKVPITYPSNLLDEIEKEVGEYYVYPDPGQAYSDSGVDVFLQRLYQTTETRFRVVDYLRKREDWDFLMVVLNGTDAVQHAMWKYMDPNHPLHAPAKYQKYGNAILEYYQYVDRELAKFIQTLSDDTVLILMSDHGFGPFYKFIHVNNWLIQEGFQVIRKELYPQLKYAAFKIGFTPMNIYNLLMAFGFGRLKREVVRGKGQGFLKSLFLSFDEVNWARTAAYSLGNVGQIRLNVVGREPFGCVKPGSEYEAVREQIISRLKELRDPQTGVYVVDKIFKREEIYHGGQLEHASDIIFIPRNMEYFGFGEYEFGSNRIIETMQRGISGTHRMNGMFLLWGKPVKSGQWLNGVNIIDLTPTILYIMGKTPQAMDGRVIKEALRSECWEQPFIVQDQSDKQSDTFDEQALSDEDLELIMKRMRGLGYVG